MFKVSDRYLSIFFFIILANGVVFSASQMKNFEISQCHHHTCFKAKGAVGYIALSGDMLSGKNVKIDLLEKNKFINQYDCYDFKYDLLAKFITCDNTSITGKKSLTINESLKVFIFKL